MAHVCVKLHYLYSKLGRAFAPITHILMQMHVRPVPIIQQGLDQMVHVCVRRKTKYSITKHVCVITIHTTKLISVRRVPRTL